MRIGRDFKAKLTAHREHRCIFAQHLPLDNLEPFRAGVFDDQLIAATMPGTAGAGAAITTRSGTCGSASIVLNASIPSIAS